MAELSPADRFVPVELYVGRQLPDAFEDFGETVAGLLDGQPDGTYSLDATAFYSRGREGLSEAQLTDLDALDESAEAAAVAVGGLMVYFRGERLDEAVDPDPELDLDFCPDCLSFCVWHSAEQAEAGSSVPEHAAAAERVEEWYEAFDLRKYTVTVSLRDGASPEVEVTPQQRN